jgi:endogenous inhibitor of DNA gyrase (YacG/DUF329 family)
MEMGIFLVCLGSRLPQAAWHASGQGEGGDQSFYRSFQLETLMSKKLCANCGQPFTPRPQARTQTYCSDPRCQQARRQDWLEAKLQSDPHYRENKARVQKAWQERNPDYWRKYRESNPEIAYKNQDAQRAPIPLPPGLSGLYRIRAIPSDVVKKTRGSLRSRPYVQIAPAKMTPAKIVLDGDLSG